MCLSEFSDTTKALIKLYANQNGLALIFFFFYLTVMGQSCEMDATMRTFSNAVIVKKNKNIQTKKQTKKIHEF